MTGRADKLIAKNKARHGRGEDASYLAQIQIGNFDERNDFISASFYLVINHVFTRDNAMLTDFDDLFRKV
jgi:hypothetical protein